MQFGAYRVRRRKERNTASQVAEPTKAGRVQSTADDAESLMDAHDTLHGEVMQEHPARETDRAAKSCASRRGISAAQETSEATFNECRAG